MRKINNMNEEELDEYLKVKKLKGFGKLFGFLKNPTHKNY